MSIQDIALTLLPLKAFDTVAIFDQSYNRLFPNASSIKATIKETAKTMEHPIETGAIITDHRIIMPVEIELALILLSFDYQNTYSTIKQFYLNATLMVVQTRSGIYENQMIASMPHEEDPTQFDVITLILGLKQVLFVAPQYGVVPKLPKNSTTVRRGAQQSTTVPANSALYDLSTSAWSKAKGALG